MYIYVIARELLFFFFFFSVFLFVSHEKWGDFSFKEMGYGEEILIIRSYDGQSADRARVEVLERRCEVGPSERVFLFTDTMGDPICRIRNSPLYKMLVFLCLLPSVTY